MRFFSKKEQPKTTESVPEKPKAKTLREILDAAAQQRAQRENKIGSWYEARKAQGGMFLKSLSTKAQEWGRKLKSGAKTGAELAKKGLSGTADALFIDIGDVAKLGKEKVGQGIDATGDAIAEGYARARAKAGEIKNAVGDAATAVLEQGIAKWEALARKATEAANTLRAKKEAIQARMAARYQEWEDSRPHNRIAKLEALVMQLQSQVESMSKTA